LSRDKFNGKHSADIDRTVRIPYRGISKKPVSGQGKGRAEDENPKPCVETKRMGNQTLKKRSKESET